jgi:hypothetical protein
MANCKLHPAGAGSLANIQSGQSLSKNKKRTNRTIDLSFLVPGTGIEPAHPCEYQILSLTRLPVPPSGHIPPGKAGRNITELTAVVQKGVKNYIFSRT